MVHKVGNPREVSWVSGFFRLVLGGIFVISGLAKIADPVRTLLTFREFQLFPGSLEVFLAVYIPWLEFILGLSTVLGILHRSSAILLAGLNLLFILAIGSLLVRGIKVDCGCFGLIADLLPLPDQADWKAIGRNLIFMGIALFIARAETSPFSLENYLKKSKTGRGKLL
jgi:putative oxidoreductase